MKIDLHSHTLFSDGVFSPETLLDRAVSQRIDVLAITDHDTTAGVAPAQAYIKSQQLPLTLIPGVEISTAWHEFEIHVVGLAIDVENTVLQQGLAQQRQQRLLRAQEMARRLTKHNVPDCLAEVQAMAGEGAITRTHFAKHLMHLGKAASINQVFKHYLSRGKPGYVPNNWVELAQAIDWIHAAGGVAVLAHPLKYNLNGRWLTKLVDEFASAGGDAVEVASAQLTPVQKRQVWQLCQKFGLKASVGSDFHQPTPWNELGRSLYLTDDIDRIWSSWALPASAYAAIDAAPALDTGLKIDETSQIDDTIQRDETIQLDVAIAAEVA
jgi:hypothetical protein